MTGIEVESLWPLWLLPAVALLMAVLLWRRRGRGWPGHVCLFLGIVLAGVAAAGPGQVREHTGPSRLLVVLDWTQPLARLGDDLEERVLDYLTASGTDDRVFVMSGTTVGARELDWKCKPVDGTLFSLTTPVTTVNWTSDEWKWLPATCRP